MGISESNAFVWGVGGCFTNQCMHSIYVCKRSCFQTWMFSVFFSTGNVHLFWNHDGFSAWFSQLRWVTSGMTKCYGLQQYIMARLNLVWFKMDMKSTMNVMLKNNKTKQIRHNCYVNLCIVDKYATFNFPPSHHPKFTENLRHKNC